jgi:hypothetical protein
MNIEILLMLFNKNLSMNNFGGKYGESTQRKDKDF